VSATQSIVVVPAGTFRLAGDVTGLGSALDGALVQVTAGIGAGLSSSTISGAYRLYGVAGDIQVSVSNTGYVTITQAVTVTSNTSLHFDLMPVTPPPDLAGTYTLAITADPSCTMTGDGALPSVARERRYGATISQTGKGGPPLKVALSGATFAPNSINAFYGFLRPDGATFDVNEPGYYYCGCRDLAELLPDSEVYLVSGHIDVTRSGNDLVGSLNGTIRIALGPNFGNVVAQCTSAHHPVTFTNQSGSPSRSRTRR
jgi:hypothetical protein